MQVYSEIYCEEFHWVTFAFNADVVDDPEPYRSLVLERYNCLVKQTLIAQAQLTGGCKRRQINKHAQKHADITKEYFGNPAVHEQGSLRAVQGVPSVNIYKKTAFA